PPEQALVTRLFAAMPSILLVQENYKPIGEARDALRQGLSAAYDGTLFTDNFLWSGFGGFLSGALIATVLVLMGQIYDQDRLAPLLFGVLLPVLPILGGCFMIRAGRRRAFGGTWLIVLGAVLIAIFVLIGLSDMATFSPNVVGIMPAVA